ncbi:MAG: hypothetical protein MJ147_07850 [Clostridia bacterium]|nr:hypothetical protein [Clostridia bacterium]
MDAMLVGMFTWGAMWTFFVFLFVFNVVYVYFPPLLLRFYIYKRPLEKAERTKLYKIECVFYGILLVLFNVVSVILQLKNHQLDVLGILKADGSLIVYTAFHLLIQRIIMSVGSRV